LPNARVVAQSDGNLGERLGAVDRHIRAAGGRRILYIGSDAPGLTPAVLNEAAMALDRNDAVFIPARDGGVTLMGAAIAWPELAKLSWETGTLGNELQECCERQGFSTCNLATGFDIDLRQDLVDAPGMLQNDSRPGRQALLEWIEAQPLTTSAAAKSGSVSIVIPVYRDPAALKQLLAKLERISPAASQVIVVDGDTQDTGETNNADSCAAVCALYRRHHIAAAPCRGEQLRLGAASAHGEILWFLHADSDPPTNAIELIRTHINEGYVGGYFRFRFQGKRRWYKPLLEWSINLRARLGTPYGDQGLFALAAAYNRAGGFAASPLFEEVVLVRKLRRQGRFRAVSACIGVSTRRWERDGWLRRSLHNRYLAIAYMLGASPEQLVRRYDKQAEIP
jgi:rSAM/selenodomain-associated transferase 2